MGQRAESVEQHCGELYDQYQREKEDEDETDRLELQILFRDVYLQNRSLVKYVTTRDKACFFGKKCRTKIKSICSFNYEEKEIEIVK